MKYDNILIEQENSIQVITINRPSKLNALNKQASVLRSEIDSNNTQLANLNENIIQPYS